MLCKRCWFLQNMKAKFSYYFLANFPRTCQLKEWKWVAAIIVKDCPGFSIATARVFENLKVLLEELKHTSRILGFNGIQAEDCGLWEGFFHQIPKIHGVPGTVPNGEDWIFDSGIPIPAGSTLEETMSSILTRDTPPKTNMEPENDGFQKESPFPGVDFQVPC